MHRQTQAQSFILASGQGSSGWNKGVAWLLAISNSMYAFGGTDGGNYHRPISQMMFKADHLSDSHLRGTTATWSARATGYDNDNDNWYHDLLIIVHRVHVFCQGPGCHPEGTLT